MSQREDVLLGSTRRIITGCGNLYTTVNYEGNKPVEVFVRLGKAGGCASCQSEALGRLITLCLQAGVSIGDLVKQLRGIGCHLPTGFGASKVLSCADAVAICISQLDVPQEEEVIYPTEETEKPMLQQVIEPTPIEETPVITKDSIFEEVAELVRNTPRFTMEPCPDCGSTLSLEEGCAKCHFCGFTRCG